jgi:putative SOS response-associated peptidase YedK
MTDRYSISASAEAIQQRFDAEIPGVHEPVYNACPTSLLPVVTLSAPQGVSTFYWGTSPAWSKNKPLAEKIINTRAEQIDEKLALKKALMKTRCIIPADGFYGWKKVGKKTAIPFRFICKDQELFSFAGLWEEYEDTDGNELHTFSVITTQANTLVATVQERMPVILNKKTEAIWLNKESTESDLKALLQAYPAEKMNHYPVSPRINDVRTNVPSLLLPTPPSDQFGNLTLFD